MARTKYWDGAKWVYGETATPYKLTDADKRAIVEAVLEEIPSGGGTDVRIDGESIVDDGVADIPRASSSAYGVVKTSETNGVSVSTSSGRLYIVRANDADILGRGNGTVYKPITPTNLDLAVKAALCDGVGAAWTEEEQAAAQARLGLVSALGVGF